MNGETPALDSDFQKVNESIPELYSNKAIRGFSFLLSTIFGGIMLSMNLKRMGKEQDIPAVMGISIGYFIIVFCIGNFTNGRIAGLNIIINAGGMYLLGNYAWNKYIGAETIYSQRSIVVPVIIGFAIAGLIFLGFYYAFTNN